MATKKNCIMETENKRFSIEDIFNLVEIQHHAIGISFIPDSESYSKYKDGITLTHITNFTIEEVLHRIQYKIFTYGEILGKGYNNTPPVSVEVIPVVFDTKDIDEIERI